MSYNVHHCNPPSKEKEGLIDVDAVAKAIKAQEPDLVALQEIDVKTKRSGLINEAHLLARKTRMNFYFAKSIDHDGGDYGIAILSKFPLSEQTTHRLPTELSTNGEPRVLATAKVKVSKNRYIRFGSLHLDAQKAPLNREMQISEIRSVIEKDSLPTIIAGDFNAHPDSKVIAELDQFMTRTCKDCAPTIPVINPKNAIDFIAFKPDSDLSVISHEVVPERYASDHLPVVSVLKLE
ncbi:MAG: endonuclease/exonuclease/phosphatase family protein [Mucilaginibacter polytrichastri]|nr:endonuclease/exonuclease/phosphatase family protein [Mucilaginibacter polytrichastri]